MNAKKSINENNSTMTAGHTSKTVYTMNNKRITAPNENYNLTVPAGKFELNVNNIHIYGNDSKNIKDIQVTERGIFILFKN